MTAWNYPSRKCYVHVQQNPLGIVHNSQKCTNNRSFLYCTEGTLGRTSKKKKKKKKKGTKPPKLNHLNPFSQ